MYLPRNLISHLYQHLLRTHHTTSPPVLLLVALEPDALCACRILTSLLRRDYIPHKIQPVSGYSDLTDAGEKLIRPMRTTEGGDGGVVVCLGVGGLVDLEAMFGLEVDDQGDGGFGGVEIWILDARRPYNLANVFGSLENASAHASQGGELVRRSTGVDRGRILQSYKPGKGGIIVFDDGDIEDEMAAERDAYCALVDMPELEDDGEENDDSGASEPEDDDAAELLPPSGQEASKKRKSWSDRDESETEDERPAQRRRSNLSTSLPSSPERPQRGGLLSTSLQRRSSDVSREGSISRSSSPDAVPEAVPKQPSARQLRRRLLRLRRKHEAVLQGYQALGASFSEPISSLLYSLASELGREDNDLLWNAIVGVSSLELYGQTHKGVGISSLSTSGGSSGWNGDRGERVRAILRDEVRRLNPVDPKDITRDGNMGDSTGVIPTTARSPTDMAIRLSPEPRFLLIRHWSLYDSMLHSPYLSTRLHVWNEAGRRRLHKLLAKMGVSLTQCKQSYTHMDMELKRGLRERLLRFAPIYGLDGLVPPPIDRGGGKEGWGFVRSWGWKACLSALDVGVVIGAILEVGDAKEHYHRHDSMMEGESESSTQNNGTIDPEAEQTAKEQIVSRFWTAYDSLSSVDLLVSHISTAQHLHRAILRTGTSLIEKKQIRHLRAFRMAVVKEGPDVPLFTHPGALIKLALWIAEAIGEMEGVKGKRRGGELVMAGLDEKRGVYIVVGLGGGGAVVASKERERKRQERRKEKEKKREERKAEKERLKRERIERQLANGLDVEDEDEEEDETEDESDGSDSDSDEEAEEREKKGYGRNRFGNAFHEVIEETGARVKVDSFEHCVVEVKKEDLSGFLESLSMKTVVG